MADRPILFSALMVRALLAGRKTQTRRILKVQPIPFAVDDQGTLCEVGCLHVHGDRLPRVTLGRVITLQEIPFAVGMRFWVKETWRTSAALDTYAPSRMEKPGRGYGWPIWYEADDGEVTWRGAREGGPGFTSPGKLRPSIFLPRAFSRLTLVVTDVRVQRLQDISEEDARAEGVEPIVDHGVGNTHLHSIAFEQLWGRLHGEGAWIANPWVAAISFDVHRANIDALAKRGVRPTEATSAGVGR